MADAPPKIAIVDDASVNLFILRKQLQRAGYENVVTTSDSTAALDLLLAERPDVLLLDVMMPQISGLEVLEMIQQRPELAGLPVIVLTAADGADVKQEALEQGAFDFLCKPCEPADLLPRIRNALAFRAHQRQLEDARRTAEQASRAKSQFLARMSHEIRTPLNGIVGMTDLLLDSGLDAAQRDGLQTVKACADHLLELINDLLDFSRIEAGRLRLDQVDFDLHAALRMVCSTFDRTAREKGITLRSRVAEDVPAVVIGDPVRLRQVLVNLVGNAVKFTEAGEVRLDVDVERQDATQTVLVFAVADTGIGIAPETLETIFDSFTQGDGTISRRYGGTGLGLAISAQLVEMMGGRIAVDSEPGRGSEFRFTARFGIGCCSVEERPREEIDLVRPLKVLVVDDNEFNGKVAVRLLERAGHTAAVAVDGREAIERVDSDEFDVVLMDVQMPGMNGLDATREIRRREAARGRHTPILATTASVTRDDEAACLAAGMDGFLAKPIDLRKLTAALQTLVESAV